MLLSLPVNVAKDFTLYILALLETFNGVSWSFSGCSRSSGNIICNTAATSSSTKRRSTPIFPARCHCVGSALSLFGVPYELLWEMLLSSSRFNTPLYSPATL